jgi:hypothetical protein
MALRSWRGLRPRLTPLTRMALMTFAWNHRHEILRWGRTLYDQLVGRADTSPARAVRTGRLLFAIASDDEFRNAKQLRKVTMIDDTVDLEVDEGWPALTRLVARVQAVPGIAHVRVNGARTGPIVTTSARG